MTKVELINIIEKSGMVLDFSRSYLMKKNKSYLLELAARSMDYQAQNKA